MTLRRFALPLAILLSGLWPAAPAWAARPLVSDSADVLEPGACEIEAALARVSVRAQPSLRASSAIFGCGAGFSTQFALAASRESGGGSSARSLVLGGKTTLLAPADGAAGFGVAYALGSSNASGSWRREDFTLTLVATRALAKGLLGHANLGWQRSSDGGTNTTLWSLGIESTGDWVWAADLFGDDRGKPSASFGLGYALTPSFAVNLSYAMQLDSARARQASVGLKISF